MFEYVDSLTAIKDLLVEHNTSTASPDLSYGLDTRLNDKDVMVGDPQLTHIRGDRYPFIFLRLSTSQEEFQTIGTSGPRGAKKLKTLNIDIYGFYSRAGASSRFSEALEGAYSFARNIEGVIQANPTLGGDVGCLWANPRNTTFANLPMDGGTWVKAALIEVEAKFLFQ